MDNLSLIQEAIEEISTMLNEVVGEKQVNHIKREETDKKGNKVDVVSVEDELFPPEGNTEKEQFNQKVIAKINDMIEGKATLEDLLNFVKSNQANKKRKAAANESFNEIVEAANNVLQAICELKDETVTSMIKGRIDKTIKADKVEQDNPSLKNFYDRKRAEQEENRASYLKDLRDARKQGIPQTTGDVKRLNKLQNQVKYYKDKVASESLEKVEEAISNAMQAICELKASTYGSATGKREELARQDVVKEREAEEKYKKHKEEHPDDKEGLQKLAQEWDELGSHNKLDRNSNVNKWSRDLSRSNIKANSFKKSWNAEQRSDWEKARKKEVKTDIGNTPYKHMPRW